MEIRTLSTKNRNLGKDEELILRFSSDLVKVRGANIHCLRGGLGPPLLLVHGFPQDWREWQHIMPRLSERFTVVAIDLRGVGRSRVIAGGYSKAEVAEDIHELVERLNMKQVYVVGHDIGGMVAYAYARKWPGDLRGVMILDTSLPGIDPWIDLNTIPLLWHFHFHQVPVLPEALVMGRQAIYFRLGFFDRFCLRPQTITDKDVKHYAESYANETQLHAAFEFYRTFPKDGLFNQLYRKTLNLPIVLAGGDHSLGPMNLRTLTALKALGCVNVKSELIADSGHYVVDEQPLAVIELIEQHALLQNENDEHTA